MLSSTLKSQQKSGANYSNKIVNVKHIFVVRKLALGMSTNNIAIIIGYCNKLQLGSLKQKIYSTARCDHYKPCVTFELSNVF